MRCNSALLALALLRSRSERRSPPAVTRASIEAVHHRCVFTTHTPVPAGQDRFSPDLVRQVLGEDLTNMLATASCLTNGTLNMTYLALLFSRYINGVSMRHEEISQDMYPSYPITKETLSN